MAQTNTARQQALLAARQELSPYLYIAGFIVVLCGLLAVSEALALDSFAPTMIPLAVLGFAFSFACRWWDIRSPVVQLLPFLMVALVLAGVANSISNMADRFGMGPQFQEEQLLVFISCLVVLLSWALVRDMAVLFCCVPTLVTISLAANIAISPVTVFCYFGYILSAAFVLAHQNYLQQIAILPQAENRIHHTPALIGQAGAACLCAVLALVVGTTVVIPAEAVFKQSTMRDVAKEMASITPHRPSPLSLQSNFNESTRLEIGSGGFGSNDPTVLLKVTPSDQAPHYWIGRTYNEYSGDGWLSRRETPTYSFELSDSSGASDSPDAVTYTIPLTAKNEIGIGRPVTDAGTINTNVEVAGTTDQYYYTGLPQSIVFSKARMETPIIAADGKMFPASGQRASLSYVVVSDAGIDSGDIAARPKLVRAGTTYPQQIRDFYLGPIHNAVTTPEDIKFFKASVAEALRGLPAGHRTPFEKAEALRAWVSRHCIYSLTVPPTPRKVDHVHHFLGTSRKGYCDLFASSLAVLCRTAGIPARVVTGFAPGVPNGEGFDVRAQDKHAWCEVFFPGSGWVTFDPTIGTTQDGSIGAKPVTALTWRDRLGLIFSRGPVPAVLLVFILGLLAYVLRNEASSRRRGRVLAGQLQGTGGFSAERVAVIERYNKMARAVAWLGTRGGSETPLEYSARIRPILAAEERRLGVPLHGETLQLLTDHFVLARYGDKAAFGARLPEIEGAKAAAGSFLASSRRARLRRMVHSFDRKPRGAKAAAAKAA